MNPEMNSVFCFQSILSQVINVIVGSGGLQLYLAPDGSVRFDQPSKLDSEFQAVIIDNR